MDYFSKQGRHILICFCLLISTATFGQFTPKTLDHFQELKGTLIYDLLPDQKGNIWIASLGGLVKYDGYEFHHFHPDPNDSTTIGSLLVYTLFEEEDGKIWIGGQGFIYCLNPATQLFSTYDVSQLLEYPEHGQLMVNQITNDGHGNMYFGALSGIGLRDLPGLVYYDPTTDEMKRLKTESGEDPKNVFQLTKVSDGSVFVAADRDAYRIGRDRVLSEIDLTDIDIGFFDDEFPVRTVGGEDGSLWFITNYSRIWKYQFSENKFRFWSYRDLFEEPFTPRGLGYMTKDNDGGLWISGTQGIIRFDPVKEEFKIIGKGLIDDNNLSNLTALKFDLFGNLWVGTRSDGIFKLPNRSILNSYVHDPEDPNSLAEGWVAEIFEGDDGSIWIPTNDFAGSEGLNKIDPLSGKIEKYLYSEIMPEHHSVFVHGEIRPGQFLFQSNQGLKIYHTKNGEISDSEFDLVWDKVRFTNDIHADDDGNIWLCSANGLFKLRDKEIVHIDLTKYEFTSDLSNQVTKLLESKRNGFWLMTNGGVFFMDKVTNDLKRHGYISSTGDVFSSQDINSMYEDKDGILWVGTWQGGLNRYNPETGEIKVYDVASGLPSMSIQGILGDEDNGALWLSTFSGMSRFNIQKEEFNNFSPEDGAQSFLYADGAYYETSKGLFVFGGSRGINIFDPDEISKNSLPPKVEITGFKVGDESIGLDKIFGYNQESIDLTYDQNNVSIEYTGIQHDNPEKNRFSYRMENFDNDWRDVGLLRSAYYYNLPSGQYTFQVKAANSNGVWSHPKSIFFIISPPWWKTWWAYLIYAFLTAAGLIYLDGWRKMKLVEKERAIVKEKELEHAREIEKAYTDLKNTQAQLIQSEKMASLGELTAGIAHEIQNPLNFVNNFSDVSNELLVEMKDEIKKGNTEDVLEIVDSLSQNLSKINHHGDRASSIVQNMLLHSKSTSDTKVATDINKLCDEFIRLSYQGLRAKDKNFNAAIESNFDPSIPEITVIPQDIGRVFLNIMNNAFYAVDQKRKLSENGFEPTVKVTTENKEDKIEISIKDNGPGIPADKVDKIFQPFFTTKPTGKGTGLGLSLSYDIIKAHGGDLSVESEIGKGSAFIIELPV